MKRNRILSVCLAAMLAVTTISYTGGESAAAVKYAPNVTSEMSKSSFWTALLECPQRCLAEYSDIEALNKTMCAAGAPMYDMANWPADDTYNVESRNETLKKAVFSDGQHVYSQEAWFDDEGKKINSFEEAKEKIYNSIAENCVDSEDTGDVSVKFAICTNRTCLQPFPTERDFFDDMSDPDFNYKYSTMMKVNEPVVLRGRSADGMYYHATASCATGWLPAEDVAICSDKEQWLDAWNFPADKSLVVVDDKIYTEDSKYAPEVANRKLPMGTCLELVDESEWQERIINRSAHNNHVVWMPVRDEHGEYTRMQALIGENRKVTEGYLPLTSENLLKVAFNQLGDAYGWGGMLGSEDCSGYLRDVYSCFGLDTCRSAKLGNASRVKTYNFEGMDDEQKTELIKTLPPGTLLSFDGHEMMYIGCYNDRLYVISSVSSAYIEGNYTRIRNCLINTLEDITRRDGRSWLAHLTYAQLPFLSASAPDPETTHAFDEGVITKGIKTYTCGTCGFQKSETLSVSVPATKIKSLKRAKKAFTVKWYKKSVTGYQIKYSRSSKFKKAKTVTVKSASTVSKKIKKLKKKKRYYVKVRCYINKYDTTYYSKWSAAKKVKTR